MAETKIEGQIEGITQGQLEFIRKTVEEQGFKDSKITIEAVGGAADNYGANVKRIVIEGEHGTSTMIAKIAPSIDFLRQAMGVVLMFKNEHLIYTEILPKMVQLQKQADVPEEDQVKFPKCYGTNMEAPNEVILLEDLKASGFVMEDRFKPLDDEHMHSVLRNLAIYHSLSYVLKSKEPETYDYYKNNMADMLAAFTQAGPEQLGFFYQIQSMSIGMLDDPEHQNIVKNKVTDIIDIAGKIAKYEHGSRYAVLLHGDCWTNNIMFKFEGETLKQSILIDYQQAKNSSPVFDLLYLIFNCTDHETRVKSFYDWLDYYHSELDKSLSNFGLKANYLYPRDQLDADLKRYGKLGFGAAVLMSGTMTINAAEAAKIKDALGAGNVEDMAGALGDLHDGTLLLYKQRLIGLIESVKLFGLL